MATVKQVNAFLNEIVPIIQQVAKERGYNVVSTIIAQACCESAYGTSSLGYKYHNYFGMKCGSKWTGKSVNMKTAEEYTVGTYTNISANFRVYDSMLDGVKGYFDFISATRYANLKTATDYRDYAEKIKADGYATSSKYVNTLCTIVEKYNLAQYDTVESPYYKKYTGSSIRIDEVFKTIGAPYGNYSTRKPVAIKNGYSKYTGKAVENLGLIALAKNGKLKKV